MGSTISRGAKNTGYDFAHIPEDIIRGEILSRLQVKTLVRLRCVCKSWKYMLSSCDPDFVQRHLTHHSMDLHNNSKLIFTSVPRKLKSKYLGMGGSVNGLVCVYYYFDRSITCAGIWNPAINLYKDIPPPPNASNVLVSNFCFGIGFDPIANDYKLIFVRITLDCPLLAHVYSCNAGSWGKMSVKSSFLSRGMHHTRPIIVHGRPYWYNHGVDHVEDYYVTYFDTRDEVFRLLPGIELVNMGRQLRVMANLRDSLAVMLYDYPESTSIFVDVYIFDEKCGAWSKNYTVGPITIPKYMSLLHCFRNGDLLFTNGKYIKFVAVNPETHAINRFGSGMYVYDHSRFQLVCSYGGGYIESLVSIKGMYHMYIEKASKIVIIERSF